MELAFEEALHGARLAVVILTGVTAFVGFGIAALGFIFYERAWLRVMRLAAYLVLATTLTFAAGSIWVFTGPMESYTENSFLGMRVLEDLWHGYRERYVDTHLQLATGVGAQIASTGLLALVAAIYVIWHSVRWWMQVRRWAWNRVFG